MFVGGFLAFCLDNTIPGEASTLRRGSMEETKQMNGSSRLFQALERSEAWSTGGLPRPRPPHPTIFPWGWAWSGELAGSGGFPSAPLSQVFGPLTIRHQSRRKRRKQTLRLPAPKCETKPKVPKPNLGLFNPFKTFYLFPEQLMLHLLPIRQVRDSVWSFLCSCDMMLDDTFL